MSCRLPSRLRPRPDSAFSLIELLVVIAIIVVLTLLLVPAFTSMKGAGDVTGAAYTVKGVLDQARTYAMANNTYSWVGFYEEDASRASTNPATPGTGRLVMSVVAAKDGVQGFNPKAAASSTNKLDITRLIPLGKLTKIENIHLPLFNIPSGTVVGDTFDTRPAIQNDQTAGYNDSRFGELNSNPTAPTTNTSFPFQYPVGNPVPTAQYTFRRTLQFNPRGEGQINSTYDIRRVVEIGLLPTHQNVAPTPSAGEYSGNVVAVQLNGFSGNVKVYRR